MADTNLIWKAPLLRGDASLHGNITFGSDDFSVMEAVRKEQASISNQVLRTEVKFGDQYRNPNTGQLYTEQRCLLDVSQVILAEGDDTWTLLQVMAPTDWVGWVPKKDAVDDQLAAWPTGGMHGGSFFEFHHAPADGNWNKPMPGSAPLYMIMTDKKIRLQLVDTGSNPRPDATWDIADLNRGTFQKILLHVKWSPNPAVGLVEAFVDDKQVVSKTTSTLFPGGYILYPVVGIYRRLFIGDPSMVWPVDAKPGVTYPAGFVPKKGAPVYGPGGFPQAVYYKPMAIGRTRDSVVNAVAAMTPSPGVTPVPVPTPTPTPPAPVPSSTAPSVNPLNAATEVMQEINTLNSVVKSLNDRIAKLQALLDAGRWTGTVT